MRAQRVSVRELIVEDDLLRNDDLDEEFDDLPFYFLENKGKYS